MNTDVVIQRMLREIDDAVGRTQSVPELDVMQALVDKSEEWKMRLNELKDEGA